MPKLSVEKLVDNLKSEKVAPVYLFIGEDTYSKKELIQQIFKAVQIDDFNFYQEDADKADIGEALVLANTSPAFSSFRMVVLRGIDKLKKDPKEAIFSYLENPLFSTVLVLTYNDNKKLKTERKLQELCSDVGVVVACEELKDAELATWVMRKAKEKGLSIDATATDLLCESIGSDLCALQSELEKISLYLLAENRSSITQEDILACLGYTKEENPFALTNAITSCNKVVALQVLDKFIAVGEEPVAILNKMASAIIRMARIRRLLDSGIKDSKEIGRLAGLLPWEYRLVYGAKLFPSQQKFLTALNRIIEADSQFKSSTTLDPKVVLKNILLGLFS